MHSILTGAETDLDARIERAVELVLELAGAQQGLLLREQAERVVCVGIAAPSPELLAWAAGQLAHDKLTTAFLPDLVANENALELTLSAVKYRAFPLFGAVGSAAPAAALVLGFRDEQPRGVPWRVLSLLAEHLTEVDR